MVGKAESQFMPNEKLNRAEMAMIISRVVGKVEIKESTYTDIVEDAWYQDAINTVATLGIVTGYPDQTFKPSASINRAETIVSLVRTLEYLGSYEKVDTQTILANFKDGDKVPEWAKDQVAWAIQNKLVSGYPDGTLGLDKIVTRAEMAKILDGFITIIE